MMRKSSIVLLLPVLLCSCVNHKTNAMFEFDSTQVDEETTLTFHLVVTSISKTDFDNANGLNVLEDVVEKNNYYFITFTKIDSGSNIEKLDFYNLQDMYPNTKSQPVTYIDDNENEIGPDSNQFSCTFFIQYNGKIIIFKEKTK